MINLLPNQEKRELQAARTNVLLIRYNAIWLGAVVLLTLATGGVYAVLANEKAAAEQTISENEAQAQEFAATSSAAEQFRNNLTTAKTILDNEITYSNVLVEIAQIVPSGVVLENLDLDASTFGNSTTFSAKARSYDSALSLKEAFENSSIFTDVNFQSISTAEEDNGGYPVSIQLNATISKEAA